MERFQLKGKLRYHLAFWVIYLIYLSSFTSLFIPFEKAIPRGLLTTLFHACLVYGNLLWLYPKFFLAKKHLKYIGLGLLLILLLSGIQFLLIPPIVEGFVKVVNAQLRYFGRVSIGMGAVFLMSTLFTLIIDFLRQEKKKAAIQQEQLISELKFLKSQLNPHFLFNTLNNVYSLCHLKDEKAAPMVMKLSELMRYMLYDCQAKQVALTQEVSFIQNFIDLQRLKTDWEQALEVRISGDIGNYQIAPLLFLPFVENLAKHSNLNTQPDAQAVIHLSVSPTHELDFRMENTIRSASHGNPESSGIGLSNVQKRLNLLYPNQHTLHYQQEDGWFKIQLKLQLYTAV